MTIIKSIAHKQKFFAPLGLLYGAACWGLVWYPYRLLSNAGMDAVASSFFSYSITLIIGGLIFAARAHLIKQLPLSAYCLCITAGWTNLSYVMAVIDGEVMRVMLLFYLSPVWTLLLAHFWLKEPFHQGQVLAIALAFIGAWFMLSHGHLLFFPVPNNASEWLALSAGMSFALTNVMTRRASHLSLAAKSMLVWFGVTVMSAIFLMAQSAGISNAIHALNTGSVLMLMLVALMLLTATITVQYGVTRMLAMKASVIFLFELVVAAIATYYWTNESLTWIEWLGGGLIIVAGLVTSFEENT